MLAAPRTTLAVLSCLILLAGCSAGGEDASSPSASAPRSSTAPSAGASSDRTTGQTSGDLRLGDVDVKNFRYLGGCGFEVPAAPIKVRGGKQTNRTPEFHDTRSTAELTGSQQVSIGGTDYVLARFSCKVAKQKLVAAHLIGAVDGKPTDLGIVATGTKISADSDHDRLAFSTTYRTADDDEGEASGKASYTVEMKGRTPIRIFGGEDAGKINGAVADLPPHSYDAGLVGMDSYLDDPDESTWLIGLLDKPGRVLSSDSVGGGYDSECLKLSVHTQDGETIDGGLRAFPDDDAATGTALDLQQDAKAEPGKRAELGLPIKNERAGLLIPANGVVPALATVTTRTSDDQLKSPLVITRAPADAWIDIWRFGAASGSEYPLPIGAFATADGKIAMTGAWYRAPIDESAAAFGMRPLLAPDTMGEKTCG